MGAAVAFVYLSFVAPPEPTPPGGETALPGVAPVFFLVIGLNSGTVVAGNVGGGGRLEFSVIGDAVNVAARVEAATRKTGDVVLLAENVRRLLHAGGGAPLDERPGVSLKGKSMFDHALCAESAPGRWLVRHPVMPAPRGFAARDSRFRPDPGG